MDLSRRTFGVRSEIRILDLSNTKQKLDLLDRYIHRGMKYYSSEILCPGGHVLFMGSVTVMSVYLHQRGLDECET